MISHNILLSTINDVKNFTEIASGCDYEMDLVSGRYTVDAKSIVGIFSLDLSKPIKLVIHSDNADDILGKLERFLVV